MYQSPLGPILLRSVIARGLSLLDIDPGSDTNWIRVRIVNWMARWNPSCRSSRRPSPPLSDDRSNKQRPPTKSSQFPLLLSLRLASLETAPTAAKSPQLFVFAAVGEAKWSKVGFGFGAVEGVVVARFRDGFEWWSKLGWNGSVNWRLRWCWLGLGE
ncbi:hypothetical protein V6N11_080560 [Hibiscus sabdariffa]|uniref:Uncharacterized protein n=1 Tax=Hibiscus sabdariffa TaxID=183260 RepID=A0ABR2R835_9ROSI